MNQPSEPVVARPSTVRAQVRVLGVAEEKSEAIGLTIVMTSHLWISWLRIAVDALAAAKAARAAFVTEEDGVLKSQYTTDEFERSVVAVAASAHALDALYGSQLIDPSVRSGFATGTKRHGKIREALKSVADTGPVNTPWVTDFGWLFDLRDAAAHAEEQPKPAVPHPAGGGYRSQEQADYCVENAERAVDFALSVLRRCVDFPRVGNDNAIAWAQAAREPLAALEQRRQGSSSPR